MDKKKTPFIAYHPDYLLKLPDKHRVPITKYVLLPEQLLFQGVARDEDFFAPEPVDTNLLKSAHDPDYVERALHLQLDRKEIRRIGYPYNVRLITRALRIVQGTIISSEIALRRGIGFNIAGGTHHAGSNWGEGFCLFNDVATASFYLFNHHDIKRILIIDLDVHQGNGTAEIMKNEPRVFTFSVHGKNNFPFEKEHSDLDIGLEDGTEGQEYLSVLEKTLSDLFQRTAPEFVFFLAGADVLWNDKMGRLKLTKEDCRLRDKMVFQFCKRFHVPVQVDTAGGYSKSLADLLDVHTQTFEEGIKTIME